jgi:Transposase DDE domain
MKINSDLTRIADYIKEMLPWAHGHQVKTLTTFVAAILEKQTGNQAALARTQGNQEAACKRLGRLLHNPRLAPNALAEAVCQQALRQLPCAGIVRCAIDWTSEGDQHLLVVSLVIGRRAVPIYWRAYAQSVLKGRMKRYELAVVKRAFHLMTQVVAARRLRVTADRGFADGDLFAVLQTLRLKFDIRVKGSTKVQCDGQWHKLNRIKFVGHSKHRTWGWVDYCQSAPTRAWVTMSRHRDRHGQWQSWYLLSNYAASATTHAREYGQRFGCEEGFRDAKWYLGFKQAHITCIRAWARLFALFACALLMLTTLGTFVFLQGPRHLARQHLRRVASRRRERCELSMITATLALLQQDWTWLLCLLPHTKFNLEKTLHNVS